MATKPVLRTTAECDAFLASPPMKVNIGGTDLYAAPRKFSTGAYGYSVADKVTVLGPDGTPLRLMVSLNPVVIGSNPNKDKE